MRKTTIGILGILACAASPLCADGFSEDDALIAGKGVFPTDDTGNSEASMPEADMSDDDTDDTNSNSKNGSEGYSPKNPKTEKDIIPQNRSNGPSGEKEFYPQSKN